MNIVIPGGTGQVGTLLAHHFHSAGHTVTVLSRNPPRAPSFHEAEGGESLSPWRTVFWDGESLSDWISALEHADAVINLAGRSVNCRYNAANRRAILDSRVRSTLILHRAIAQLEHPPAVWLNASTATIYRHALDRPMDEPTGELGGNEPGAPSTWNFSIEVARAWEAAFFSAPLPRTRQIALRSAMTMSPDRGGVFDVLLSLVRHDFGGTIGPGTQYVSWIHHADFCRAIEFLIAHPELDGPINLASPNPLPMRDFLRDLRRAWSPHTALPTPAIPTPTWLLEIGTFLLRTESELVLKSRRVIPTRLTEAGFHFLHPTWPEAAQDLVDRWRTTRTARN